MVLKRNSPVTPYLTITAAEANNVIKGLTDISMDGCGDGCRAIWMLNKRFDATTYSGVLHAFLVFVKPQVIKNSNEVTPGIHRWEANVAILKNRWDKDLDK